MFWIVVVLVLIALALAFTLWSQEKTEFEKQGLKFIKSNPLVDMFNVSLKRIDFFLDTQKLYNSQPDSRGICVYSFNLQSVMIRDPELIQQITIKDFDHYANHVDTFLRDDPLFSTSLFALKNKRWHGMRSTLSPAFTGSKMRIMFELMNECGIQVVQYFNELIMEKGTQVEIECKDITTRFTNDMIATTAFGIKVDSFANKENEFYQLGKQFRDMAAWKFFALATFPNLCKKFGITLFPLETYSFFESLVKDTIDTRLRQKIIRPDMIQLLLEAKEKSEGEKRVEEKLDKDDKMTLTDTDIAAQSFSFFFGGFETVSIAMCFAMYELTVNPEIQRKLQAEIDQTLSNDNGKLIYDSLSKMKYLDMVVSETMRKWPPMSQTDRVNTKPQTLDLGNGKSIEMNSKLSIQIPIFALHRDEKYFPDPEKFDPERFSDENKHLIKQGTYLPFGSGPRICIASRFVLCEVKVMLVHLLANFSLEVVEKTPIPFKLRKGASILDSETGFWVGVKARTK